MLPLLLILLVLAVLLAFATLTTQGRTLTDRAVARFQRPTVDVVNDDGEEFKARAPTPRRSPRAERRADRRFLPLVVAIAIGVVGVVAATRMLGNDPEQFVVLIAPFSDPDGATGQTGRSVAEQLANRMNGLSDNRIVARVLDDPPADAGQALTLMQRQNADALLWGTVASGALANEDALQPMLAYRPTGSFAPAAWDNYTARFAMPTTYMLTGGTLNGEAVLVPLVGALADYGAGDVDRAFNTLGTLADDYPALAAPLPRAVRGNILWARGEYPAAAEEYRRTGVLAADLQQASQVALLANNLGAILQDARDPAANEIFGRAETQLGGQELGELRVNQGLAALQTGDTQTAVQRLERARQLLPASAPLLLALAEAYRANGQFDLSGRTLDEANGQIDVDARMIATPYQELVTSRLQATALETQAMLQLAAPIRARNPLLWEFQGERTLTQQQTLTDNLLTSVRDTAQRAVDTTDDLARRWSRRAVAEDASGNTVGGLLANGQARRALDVLRERQRFLAAVELELGEAQGYEPASGVSGVWRTLAGDRSPVGQARTRLEELLQLQPEDVDTAVLLGNALLLSGEGPTAGQRFDVAAATAPNRPEPVYGQALVALPGDRARGRLLLQRAVALDTRYYPARETLAEISEQDGDWALAVEQRRELDRQRPNTATKLALARALRLSGPGGYAESEQLLLPLANAGEAVALLELGRLYTVVGNAEAARAALERAVQAAPRNAEVAYELGQVLAASGNTAGAESQLKVAVEVNPRYTEAQLALGKLYTQLGRANEAAVAYTAALDSGLRDPLALKQIGAALLDDGVYDKAQQAYEQVVQTAPNDAEAHHGLGQAHLRQRQLDQAQTAEQQALSLRGNAYPQALVALGDIALERGDPEGAVTQYNAALQIDPQLTPAYLGRGRAAATQGNWAVARDYFQTAANRDAQSAEAQLWLGEALIRLEDRPGAIAAYGRALEIREDYPEAYFGLAQAQLDAGQLDGATTNLQQAIQRRAGYAEAYLLQGKLFEQQNRANDATAAYGNAITANEQLAEPYYRRALLYVQGDRVSDAENDLLQAVRIQPNFPEAHYWLGRTYLVEGNATSARDQFQLAVTQRNGAYPEALFYQGQAEEQLGQRAAAASSFRTALDQAQGSPWASEAQDAISRLGQ